MNIRERWAQDDAGEVIAILVLRVLGFVTMVVLAIVGATWLYRLGWPALLVGAGYAVPLAVAAAFLYTLWRLLWAIIRRLER